MLALSQANCDSTQRPASLSYWARMSPWPLVRQASAPGLPTKLAHGVLPLIGPSCTAPVALLKIDSPAFEFTHCTYCVAPTAPFTSDGAEPFALLPSKFNSASVKTGCGSTPMAASGPGAALPAAWIWANASGAPLPRISGVTLMAGRASRNSAGARRCA